MLSLLLKTVSLNSYYIFDTAIEQLMVGFIEDHFHVFSNFNMRLARTINVASKRLCKNLLDYEKIIWNLNWSVQAILFISFLFLNFEIINRHI